MKRIKTNKKIEKPKNAKDFTSRKTHRWNIRSIFKRRIQHHLLRMTISLQIDKNMNKNEKVICVMQTRQPKDLIPRKANWGGLSILLVLSTWKWNCVFTVQKLTAKLTQMIKNTPVAKDSQGHRMAVSTLVYIMSAFIFQYEASSYFFLTFVGYCWCSPEVSSTAPLHCQLSCI